jgi:methylated-DNA-[protein]-cysteine S-methyltransferase
MFYDYYDSPIGCLRLVNDGQGLSELKKVLPDAAEPKSPTERAPSLFDEVHSQLDEYFAGSRTSFALKLSLKGTAFQLSVWRALMDIPFGRTTTYSDIARRIQNPLSVRAVGAANGANPICIIVPCHRVIGRDGSLTGYAGGLSAKATLLRLEGFCPQEQLSLT